ncbi:MAG TPA: hypothetical protein DEF42_01560 [Desulfosporosinus sp.]|nr:hypothetical protein [Desulfosporosinus sp.]
MAGDKNTGEVFRANIVKVNDILYHLKIWLIYTFFKVAIGFQINGLGERTTRILNEYGQNSWELVEVV